MLAITAGSFEFAARFEEDTAPETVAAFRRMLPLDSKIIHVRWSGEGGWIPMGDLDVGIGLNTASRHKDEAREFLAWMARPEFGELIGNEMPGFFPMHRAAPTLANVHANAFLTLNQGRGTDIRFAWEKLRDGSPDGYVLMQDGTLAVLRGEQTPQQAADALQAGLAQWFEPAMQCER